MEEAALRITKGQKLLVLVAMEPIRMLKKPKLIPEVVEAEVVMAIDLSVINNQMLRLMTEESNVVEAAEVAEEAAVDVIVRPGMEQRARTAGFTSSTTRTTGSPSTTLLRLAST